MDTTQLIPLAHTADQASKPTLSWKPETQESLHTQIKHKNQTSTEFHPLTPSAESHTASPTKNTNSIKQ